MVSRSLLYDSEATGQRNGNTYKCSRENLGILRQIMGIKGRDLIYTTDMGGWDVGTSPELDADVST